VVVTTKQNKMTQKELHQQYKESTGNYPQQDLLAYYQWTEEKLLNKFIEEKISIIF